MERESIVYGCIRDLPFGDDNECRLRRLQNQRVINRLPDQDDWPFLSREMFASTGDQPVFGTYQTQVIHFGASYAAVEYEWELWMQKFEELLRKMYWVSATVHLETELSGNHIFQWDSKTDFHNPDNPEMSVRCEWNYEPGIVSRPSV